MGKVVGAVGARDIEMDALEVLAQWGPLGMLILIGFLWIMRVEKNLEKHENKCSERYSIIFAALAEIKERLARIEEKIQ